MNWTRNQGAPRVQFEIAEEFRELGHLVDKFDISDALPPRNQISSLWAFKQFSIRATQFIREYGINYDVIDAHQANLPFSKQQLGFRGLLCARSCGLIHSYFQYERDASRIRRARKQAPEGSLAGNAYRSLAQRLGPQPRDAECSFTHADLINVLNTDEYNFVTEKLGWVAKTVLFPHGLQEQRFVEFDDFSLPPAERFRHQQIVFIGSWSERKGSRDFPEIVRQISQQLPGIKFLLLGTGLSSEPILSRFHELDRPRISVVPTYNQEDLPALLCNSTVAMFPSYCEGFPWSVLEKLAAGIPVIAYDIPGVRDMLNHCTNPAFPNSLMVERGNITALAEKLVSVLGLSVSEYCHLSLHARQIANQFRGREIAQELLRVYKDRLEQLGRC